MLKISVHDSPKRRSVVLEGKAMAPWIEELGAAWSAANSGLCGRRLEVDLRNVTAISEEGERALWELIKKGARFRCSGVLTKHVLHELLRRRSKETGSPVYSDRHSP